MEDKKRHHEFEEVSHKKHNEQSAHWAQGGVFFSVE
jgi:hypothetical protein